MAIVKVTTITRNIQQVDSSSNAETRSIQNSIIQGKPERKLNADASRSLQNVIGNPVGSTEIWGRPFSNSGTKA